MAPKIALDRAITDALFASAAEREHIDEPPPSARPSAPASRAPRSNSSTTKPVEASRPTPRSPRPPSVTSSSSIARRPFASSTRSSNFPKKPTPPPPRARARSPNAFSAQVAHAKDEPDFRARAEALTDRGGLDIVVETLKPVAADGRVVDVDHPSPDIDTYVLPFARAASRLTEPGQKSGVVTTRIRLSRRDAARAHAGHVRPPRRAQGATPRTKSSPTRAGRLKAELLERLAAATPATIERSADTLLATVGHRP